MRERFKRIFVTGGIVVASILTGCAEGSGQQPVETGQKLLPGVVATITGPGRFNPGCFGAAGVSWEMNNPNEYANTCTLSVPSSGKGVITANEIGAWTKNGTFRVCLVGTAPGGTQQRECGWYPPESLEPSSTQ